MAFEQAREWLQWDPNPNTRQYIQELVDGKEITEIESRFSKRLEFGTAGLRGPMGAGTCFMNDLVILQTTQGLCDYLIQEVGEKAKEMGVVVGYDHRQSESLVSRQFAEYIAAVFISREIPVFLFSKYVPTPFVPFCVDLKQCAAGIMVTASHNPKQDNGYKLYWSNGCQIIPPRDEIIAQAIRNNLKPWKAYDISNVQSNKLVFDPMSDVVAAYYTRLSQTLCRFKHQNEKPMLKIAYTAMHGVGQPWAKKAFEAFSLPPFVSVLEQEDPNPDFPTVKYPNPEEGQGALTLAFAAAEANNCNLILANDPDADRLAAAERLADGTWKIFTGNETAALLGHWEWTQLIQAEPSINPSDVYIVASTVSSKMLNAVARAHGFNFEETLTGFKYMGNRSVELRNQGKRVIFAFEEAIGYCVGDLVKDKDGISSAAVFAEMANEVARQGKSVTDQLKWLHETYGFFFEKNYYVKCYDPATTNRIFDRLRNNGMYFSEDTQWSLRGYVGDYFWSCGPYQIERIRDQTTGYDSGEQDKRTRLPVTPSVQMITYTFANGFIATLRTSGTEPKIKYYVEKCCSRGESVETATQDLTTFVDLFVLEMLQPSLNNLE